MIKFKISYDISELIFRLLFSLIFLGLGAEHIFSDTLIQHLMPEWMPFPRIVSFMCGIWLFFWGSLVAIGFKIKYSAIALGGFL